MPVQNKDIRRKLRLRQELVLRASDGAVYVPFCGDGEMAEAYAGRAIYAADIDQKRVETFRKRFPDARVKAADVNKEFPFSESDTIYSIADFDAWDYPYDALRLFLSAAQTTDRLVIFITDGMFQAITRKRTARDPDGTPILGSQCRSVQKYLSDFVLTYLRKILSPRTIREESHFTINDMIYLGIVAARIDNGQASETDADSLDVERVLCESRDSRRMGRPKWELTDERLRVEGGRLVCDTDRGVEAFGELSPGERWRIALEIAVEQVGEGGLVTVPQEAWEALDSVNRAEIAEIAKQVGVVLLTAEADEHAEIAAEVIP